MNKFDFYTYIFGIGSILLWITCTDIQINRIEKDVLVIKTKMEADKCNLTNHT